MRVDHIELGFAARRARARGIATFFASAFVWLLNTVTRQAKPGYKAHAARPHFAR
jgi:hypothetical protein